jgi:hypothetical protein
MQFLTSMATRCVCSCCDLPISRSSRIRLQWGEIQEDNIVRMGEDQGGEEVEIELRIDVLVTYLELSSRLNINVLHRPCLCEYQ